MHNQRRTRSPQGSGRIEAIMKPLDEWSTDEVRNELARYEEQWACLQSEYRERFGIINEAIDSLRAELKRRKHAIKIEPIIKDQHEVT